MALSKISVMAAKNNSKIAGENISENIIEAKAKYISISAAAYENRQ
jgi:hypothetical protein